METSIESIKTAWPIVADFLTPPQTLSEYQLLQARLDQLEQEAEEGSNLETLLDYLGELLDEYELNHFPEVERLDQAEVTAGEILRRFMEKNGIKQIDLAPVFGAQSRVSEVLNGKRQITLSQVKQLHEIYKLPVNLFL
ncbi:MAG: helix-turn-helix domain-containing protein [SAR324 cluster bacterium]|nr:helix-turn-helix domain-containing protein [SAR324 cluster bacterium]